MLAAPLTVCLVVLGKYVPSLGFFDILLGDEPVLTADVNLYQRLLARSEDDAVEIIRNQARTLSPVELCDQLLIPTLVHARQDAERDLLSEAEFQALHSFVRELLREESALSPVVSEGAGPEDLDRPPLFVLGCAARDAADATALEMLALHLEDHAFRLVQLPTEKLVSEVVEEVERQQPAVVCLISLPPGGMSHTRHLCKRLRQRFADLKIVVGRWGATATPELREQLLKSDVDYIGVTLEQTCQQLDEVAQFLRPATLPAPNGTQLRSDSAHAPIATILPSVSAAN
jgi:hypothetical protein